jgi:uncharacterized membrane protein YccC
MEVHLVRLSGSLIRIFTVWYDKLIAADPGLNRLRFAGRATLTVVATVGLIHLLILLTGKSLFDFFIGIVVSMISSLAVSDTDRKQKMITAALIPVPSMIGVAIGGILSGTHYIAEAVFVVVMFVAVYIRRYGPRWFAFGMVLFISYFFAMFIGASAKQLPWMFLAIFIGSGVSFLFRFLIIQDPEHLSVSTVMPAVRARLRLILKELGEGFSHPEKISHHYNRMKKQSVYLNEITLLNISEGENESWYDALFEIDLAAQQIIALGEQDLDHVPEEDMENIISDIHLLVAELGKKTPLTHNRLNWSLNRENKTHRLFKKILDVIAKAEPAKRQDKENAGEEDEPDDSENENKKALLPTTRQAIQVAVANVIAIAGGELISSKRWYWAAITAFIVFTGTSSRGHVFVKGGQRVAGTFFGVIAGILIATLVNGNEIISLILISTSIFLGFYFLSVSYAVMIFWITVLLALLYGLLGFFSINLLSLRLEETVIGAVAGVGVAVFLFPTKTHQIALQRSQEFLSTLNRLLGESAESFREPGKEGHILESVQDMDNAFQELRKAARPLTYRIQRFTEPRTSQHWLRVMLQLRYEAHVLARLSRLKGIHDSTDSKDLSNFTDHLREKINQISQAIENTSPRKKTLKHIETLSAESLVPLHQEPNTAYEKSLKKIECILVMLANDIGAGSGTPNATNN